jgi:hypothetical protein
MVMIARATPHQPAGTVSLGTAPVAIGSGRLSLVVAFYFLMIALPIQFDLGPVFMTGVRVVLIVTAIPITIRLFSGQLGRMIPTDFLLLAYVLWAVATLFVNSRSQAVSIGGAYFLEVYGSYLLARNYIRTPEQFRAMCRGLLTVLLFSLPFAIYETQTGQAPIPTFLAKLPGIFSWGDFYNALAGRRLGLERAQVIFSHPIHYGLFCASLVSISLVAYKYLIKSWRRYFLFGLVCIGVICSVSSGAILPMILQTGLIVWAWTFKRVQARWIILCSLIAICYVVVDIVAKSSPISVFLRYATLSPGTGLGRVYIFQWGMDNVWKNPFIGIGLNEWERPAWKSASMDNFWLLATVRYGIPGFLLLISAYLAVVWMAMVRNFGDGGAIWQFRRAWVFLQVGMIVTLATVDVWDTALSYVFFLLGAGAWLVSMPESEGLAEAPEAEKDLPYNKATVRYTRFTRPVERAQLSRDPKRRYGRDGV